MTFPTLNLHKCQSHPGISELNDVNSIDSTSSVKDEGSATI